MLLGITTIHHDKPEQSQVFKMAATMVNNRDTSRSLDRHKRLLPYINYYVNKPRNPSNRINNVQTVSISESNIPESNYVPFLRNGGRNIVEILPVKKNTDFINIYETLVHLKQAQKQMPPVVFPDERTPPLYLKSANSLNNYYEEPALISTYTPKNIDIVYTNQDDVNYREYPYKNQFRTKTVADKPTYELDSETNPNFGNKVKNQLTSVTNTVAPQQYENLIFQLEKVNERRPESLHTTTNPIVAVPETKTSNVLSRILKQLQNSNTLPQTFTTDNIDNSIKTLVKILNSLRTQQSLKIQPIVVSDDDDDNLDNFENDSPQIDSRPEKPGTTTQYFPANTIDGGTPGRPGVDYPALSTIPQTSFNCKTQRYKGFFGDPQTHCQVR